MTKLSDYIWRSIAEAETCGNTVFLVSGGGCMHLLDSVRKEPKLHYVCNHHEQACTIAAEGYARVTNRIGIALVTTGPGGTNALTGVMGAWVDSIPMLVLSGQVKLETTIRGVPGLRQLGDQEINIIDIVKPITKYAVIVTEKNDIRFHLEKAIHIAKSGRPGPVWLDIPLDIQASLIDETHLRGFDPTTSDNGYDLDNLIGKVDEVVERMASARRPAFIVGNGVRLAGAKDELLKAAELSGIPVLTAISGIDLIETGHPLFFGRPGILGARAANFIMQNSDLLLVIGTRMNLRIIGYSFETVARAAFKVMVDADENELRKPTFHVDLPIHADARDFLRALITRLQARESHTAEREWIAYCERMRKAYPMVETKHWECSRYVSSYYFAEVLSNHAPEGATVVTGNGCAYTSTFQAYRVKKDQRIFANVGCAAMGYDLPAAIGACYGNGKNQVILVTGDGSIMMNLQELQTIIAQQLPLKIFVFNNDGYLSMKITQDSFFGGVYTGADPSSGVHIPDLGRLAQAFGYQTERIESNRDLGRKMPQILSARGALFIEVTLDPHELLYPKTYSVKKEDGTMVSRPLEDLYPFLPRDEFRGNMIIEAVED